jgi:hypothetical protein
MSTLAIKRSPLIKHPKFQGENPEYGTVAFSVNAKVLLEKVKANPNACLFCALTCFWTAIAHGVRNSTKSPTPCLHGWPEDGHPATRA